MVTSKKRRPADLTWLLVLLGAIPMGIMLAKMSHLPWSDVFREHVSLVACPAPLQAKLAHILFVPLGAMLVVLVRLTLGLRVLGPFRSILLAVAFQTTGIWLGLAFLTVTILLVTALRPSIHAMRLPYFGRITVMLSMVAVLMVLAIMIGNWFELNLLRSIVFFPIVVLCLVADAFARTIKTEGRASALWRGALTAGVAVALAALAQVPAVQNLLLRHPELLIAQIAGIIFLSQRMNWRLLEWMNPKVCEDEEEDDENEEERWRNQARTLVTPAARTPTPDTVRDDNIPVSQLP